MPQGAICRLRHTVLGAAVLVSACGHAIAAQMTPPAEERSEPALIAFARQHPDDFAAQQRAGEFYLQQGHFANGISYLEKAARLNPDDYNNGYDLSLAYLKTGDLPKAIDQLQRMIKSHETSELEGLLAEAFEGSGDVKDAAVTYDHAAMLDPSEDNVFDLASFLLQHPKYEGFIEKAISTFRYGVKRYPGSEKLTVGLGVALYADLKYDESVEVLCRAVDLNPLDPKPYQFLGRVTRVSPSLIPQIRDRLAGFVRRYPENGPANYYYAMILWEQSGRGQTETRATIEVLLKKAIAVDPGLYEAHFQLGILYQDHSDYPQAIAEFQQTLTLRPDYNRAHYRLFLLYNRTNQKDLANQQLAMLKQIKATDDEAESEGKP